MNARLWFGFGFTAALVVFLMVTYFVRDTTSPAQRITLRFLTALCGGFGGGFLAGEALFSLEWPMSNGAMLAISGTAGFAILFAVWFTYPKGVDQPVPDGFRVGIPSGWTFEQAVRAIVQAARSVVAFDGLDKTQLEVQLPAVDIDAETVVDALNQLRHLSAEIPDYRVERESGVFHIRGKGS